MIAMMITMITVMITMITAMITMITVMITMITDASLPFLKRGYVEPFSARGHVGPFIPNYYPTYPTAATTAITG